MILVMSYHLEVKLIHHVYHQSYSLEHKLLNVCFFVCKKMNCDLIYFTEMFGQCNQKKDFQRPDVVPGQYGQSNEHNLNIHFLLFKIAYVKMIQNNGCSLI